MARTSAIFASVLVAAAFAACGSRGVDTQVGSSRAVAHDRACLGGKALTLGPSPKAAARRLARRRVGRSPQIDISVQIAPGVPNPCGRRVSKRTVMVFTYDHRFDQGPHKSASLAQHRFLASRFADGYHVWYWEH